MQIEKRWLPGNFNLKFGTSGITLSEFIFTLNTILPVINTD
jgi:hypothetical protein